jgi:hypothetical protein
MLQSEKWRVQIMAHPQARVGGIITVSEGGLVTNPTSSEGFDEVVKHAQIFKECLIVWRIHYPGGHLFELRLNDPSTVD